MKKILKREIAKADGNLGVRLICYFGGMLIMTLGVAISVKSVLGVSPISSVPYTITVVTNMDLGLATALFSVVAALLEIPILRKKYKVSNLFQIVVSVIFGFFMTSCMKLVQLVPDPSDFGVKLALAFGSTAVVAVGVFLYVSSRLVPLPTEGVLIAITQIRKFKFGSLKVAGDVTMVAISLVTCLVVLDSLGSIGLGTVIAAIFVGNEVKLLSKYFKPTLDRAMGLEQVRA